MKKLTFFVVTPIIMVICYSGVELLSCDGEDHDEMMTTVTAPLPSQHAPHKSNSQLWCFTLPVQPKYSVIPTQQVIPVPVPVPVLPVDDSNSIEPSTSARLLASNDTVCQGYGSLYHDHRNWLAPLNFLMDSFDMCIVVAHRETIRNVSPVSIIN